VQKSGWRTVWSHLRPTDNDGPAAKSHRKYVALDSPGLQYAVATLRWSAGVLGAGTTAGDASIVAVAACAAIWAMVYDDASAQAAALGAGVPDALAAAQRMHRR
jgi:hypothetical protein